jgi:stalled ribosome rescue protein Dom34
MTSNIGLWIDHKKAILVIQNDGGEEIETIESEVGRHVSYRGTSPTKAPYSAQHQQGDDQLDNKFNEHLNKFYDKVIACLREAESVFIFGPGEAKLELGKRIAHAKVKAQIVGVESADKMTEAQIASKVRKYFE